MLKGDERSDVIAFLEQRFSEHRDCEDPWYSCPKHEDYIGNGDREQCWCGKDEADALIGRLYLREPKLTPHIKQRAEELSISLGDATGPPA